MLECIDGSLYTGITTDVARRLSEHQAGKGGRYTRARGAKRMLYTEVCKDRSSALKREVALKRLPRQQKLKVIQRH
jgi:putative endonuclease